MKVWRELYAWILIMLAAFCFMAIGVEFNTIKKQLDRIERKQCAEVKDDKN